MPFEVAAAVIGVAGTVYAADQQSKSNTQAEDRADPFYYHREQYANQLDSLMANPSSYTQTPGYQFQLDQGTQAINRQQAAAGGLGSGQQGIALTQYAENYAQTGWMNYANFLANLAGANKSSNEAAGVQASQNSYNANQNIGSSIGGLIGSMQNISSSSGSSGTWV